MWTIIISLAVIALVLLLYKGIQSEIKAEKAGHILTLRKPRMYDRYERKSCNQFREECKKHAIDASYINMPNLCTYLRILERKGMHIELVKDGMVRYTNNPKEEFIGGEDWIRYWDRIIFSPSINEEEFCACILKIMSVHRLSISQNNVIPRVKGLYGMIHPGDSFFIFRALHIMHYQILIRENNPSLKEYEISRYKQISFSEKVCPLENIHEVKLLKEMAKVEEGYKIREQNITTIGKHRPIVFPENILSKPSGLKYNSGGTDIDADIIVLGLKAPFDMKIWNERAIIAEGIASIEVTGYGLSCEYLYLYLKLMCHKLNANDTKELTIKELEDLKIVVVPSHVQREIIKKGMSVKDDATQLEAIFTSYHEAYPLLKNIANLNTN